MSGGGGGPKREYIFCVMVGVARESPTGTRVGGAVVLPSEAGSALGHGRGDTPPPAAPAGGRDGVCAS